MPSQNNLLKDAKPCNSASTTPAAPTSSSRKAENNEPLKTNVKLKPAAVYIFNHEVFENKEHNRAGSSQDVKILCNTFKEFNCKPEVISNPKIDDVYRKIKELKERDFTEYSALVIVVLSHGDRHSKILASDGKSYYLRSDMQIPLWKNQSLWEKPKLFFVQACKGEFFVIHGEEQSLIYGAEQSLRTKAVIKRDDPGETVTLYSNYEGFVSERHEQLGTPFVQALCELLQQLGKSNDIESIIREVIKEVKLRTDKKQIPCPEGSLSKPYCFGDYINN